MAAKRPRKTNDARWLEETRELCRAAGETLARYRERLTREGNASLQRIEAMTRTRRSPTPKS